MPIESTSFPKASSWRLMVSSAFLTLAFLATPTNAQELVQTFRDPAFGGNPFNGDYLLSIANLSRPEAPEEPSQTPTEDELLASQIKSQLTSTLSLNVLSTIQSAKVGQSGTFEFGNQQINYSKSASATTVVFTNKTTGETSQIVIPAAGSTGNTVPALSAASAAVTSMSAEQALSANSALSSSSATLGVPPL